MINQNRNLLALLLAMALFLFISPAMAEETVTAYGIAFDRQAEVLDLDAAGLSVRDIGDLEAILPLMPNLKQVNMFESRLTTAQMDRLFDGWPEIFFGWTIKLYTHTIRTDMTAFSTLHGHTGKEGDPLHNTRDLRIMRYCRYMEALDLGHNQLTDISFLAEMPQLKVLILGANYECESLAPLAALTELEYLEVFSTNCTDVTPLAGLTKLRDLNLAYNYRLKDISPLYGLPNLERFWGYNLAISKEQQAEMMAAHPDCEFDWINNPTEGTWRVHPHYDTIFRIFHDFVYYPFDD